MDGVRYRNVSIVAAMNLNNVIGRNGDLPWRLPSDLARFKTLTQHGVVVMGRKTHESIGRLLPDRLNIVVSRDRNYQPVKGACKYMDLKTSLDHFAERNEVFVIGGGQIYEATLPYANTLYLTVVDDEGEGDVYFPNMDNAFNDFEFICSQRVITNPDDQHPYTFHILRRVANFKQ